MAYPAQFRYTKEHEWIGAKGDTATIGITDYAQHELGDVVFVELPPVDAKITAGKTFGSVESVKAVSEIYAPVSDPHGTGWLIKVKLANPAEVNSLMDAAAYEAYIAEKQKEASA
jgi:glycine cleavage system H protein